MKKVSPIPYFVFYFIFCVVSNFVHPVTPAFLKSINAPDYMSGASMATISFAMFLVSPLWGKLGERSGYMRNMALGYIGYGVSQLLFSFATTPATILFARTLGGLSSASAGVNSLSYLSAISGDAETRSKYFTVYVTMQSVGAALGFLIGGMLGDISIRFVFNLQIVTVILCAVLMLIFIKDVNKSTEKQKLRISDVNPLSTLTSSLKLADPVLRSFLVVVFLAYIAIAANDTYFNYFLMDQLHFPPSANGLFKCVVGVIAIIANATINMWIIRNTDIRKSTIITLSLCSVSLLLVVSFSAMPVFLASALAYYTFSIILAPLLQSIAMQGSSGMTTGEASGLFNSIGAFGRGFGPLMAGIVYGVNPRGPFILAATFFVLAAFAGVYSMKKGNSLKAIDNA